MRTIKEIKADIASVKETLPEGHTNTDLCELEFELRNALMFDIPLERLEDIYLAEDDGRLFVLPFKLGEKAYCIEAGAILIGTVSRITFSRVNDGWFEVEFGPEVKDICAIEYKLDDINKLVFKTKRDAWKAVIGGAENEKD